MSEQANKLHKLIDQFDKTNSWLIKLLATPKIYFYAIALRALGIGFITIILNFIYLNTWLHDVKIPTIFHSLIGFVVALMLVFRTNTAYDRWWEARKILDNLYSNLFIVNARYNVPKSEIMEMLDNLFKHLRNGEHYTPIREFYSKIVDLNVFESRDLILNIESLCRIKKTPIPTSYSLHIKICIFIYLLTLPFGIFVDLGYWSTLLVMVLFYVVAGIEIISTEIEDPFKGDPNDLPIDRIFKNWENNFK